MKILSLWEFGGINKKGVDFFFSWRNINIKYSFFTSYLQTILKLATINNLLI